MENSEILAVSWQECVHVTKCGSKDVESALNKDRKRGWGGVIYTTLKLVPTRYQKKIFFQCFREILLCPKNEKKNISNDKVGNGST